MTHPLISTSQRTCQDTARLPNLTIDHLSGEVLIVIFDSYRQGYDHQRWREEYVWFNLAHVCRKWRAVMFASPFRLDLGVVVGPIKPDDIETILSGPLPIFIEFKKMSGVLTSSALWRMRAVLEQRDRVRRISFEGKRAWMDEFFSATNCTFPILDSVVLCSLEGVTYSSRYNGDLELPDTFLGGPDLSDLHLRRLKLERVSLTSISRFLSSTSALTDLSLQIDTVFGTSRETSLLACLQGMPRLCRLDLSITITTDLLTSPPSHLSPQDIVPLSNLTCFHYAGHCAFLEALVTGLSAPYLREIRMEFRDVSSPIVHLPRFINETEERFHAVHVTFHQRVFHLSLQTQSEFMDCHCNTQTRSSRIPSWSPESVTRLCDALSAKLPAVEELRVTFGFAMMAAEDYLLWRRFYGQFPGVKVFRIDGALSIKSWVVNADYNFLAPTFLRDDEGPAAALAFLPALEEVQLGQGMRLTPQSQSEGKLEVFRPFISARQQAGRPVRITFC